VPDHLLGKKVRCPECGAEFQIDADAIDPQTGSPIPGSAAPSTAPAIGEPRTPRPGLQERRPPGPRPADDDDEFDDYADDDFDDDPDRRRLRARSRARVAVQGPAITLMVLGGGIVLYGAWQMKDLRSQGSAMAASITAMLPCNLCCLVGLPVGIWSLVVLNRPEVKNAFPYRR
jgi:hypothetical protein